MWIMSVRVTGMPAQYSRRGKAVCHRAYKIGGPTGNRPHRAGDAGGRGRGIQCGKIVRDDLGPTGVGWHRMDRALWEEHLTLAETHVAQGERVVARQHEIIAELARGGHDTASAVDLLASFQELLTLHKR